MVPDGDHSFPWIHHQITVILRMLLREQRVQCALHLLDLVDARRDLDLLRLYVLGHASHRYVSIRFGRMTHLTRLLYIFLATSK